MIYETKDLVKQLELYADAITGFATVQLIGFVLLMTHGDCFSKNVVDGIWWAFGIGAAVNLMYIVLVYCCQQRGEERPWAPHAETALSSDPIMKGVRVARYTIMAIRVPCDHIITIRDQMGSSTQTIYYLLQMLGPIGR